jgi:hypothetical protein
MKKYRVEHSESTSAHPKDVWALWSDIANWPAWDIGLDACVPKGKFEPGHTFLLTPKGAPNSIEVQLVEVVPHERFVDETRLPFGTIRATHTIHREGAAAKVTHIIEAEVAPEHAEFFEKAIWSGMEQGVPHSVKELKKLAEKRK